MSKNTVVSMSTSEWLAQLAEAYDKGYNQCRQGGYPSVTYGSNLNPYRKDGQ